MTIDTTTNATAAIAAVATGISQPGYRVFIVPKSPTDEDTRAKLVQKYKALRLSALQTSPASFGARYAVEVAQPAEYWTGRLQNPHLNLAVAVKVPTSSTDAEETHLGTLLEGEWVAIFTLLGPVALEDYVLLDNGAPAPGGDDVESRWHMTALYTAPEHRGKGLAKLVIERALRYAGDQGTRRRQRSAVEGSDVDGDAAAAAATAAATLTTRVRILVHPDKKDVVAMYERLRFERAGWVSWGEALRANGDHAHLPDAETLLTDRYARRDAYAMERVFS